MKTLGKDEAAMLSRRYYIKYIGKLSLAAWLALGALPKKVWAEAKRRILPKGTDPENLINDDPEKIDASNLEITPLEKFGTMGESDREEDMEAWRLSVVGRVQRPLSQDYAQLTGLPSVERKELLICPGVFSYNAVYRGVMLGRLLQEAGIGPGAAKVVISGPFGKWDKVETFTLAEIEKGRVFLAWSVNGRILPAKHGFPLRVVAPDRYGDDWVKYVAKVEVV